MNSNTSFQFLQQNNDISRSPSMQVTREQSVKFTGMDIQILPIESFNQEPQIRKQSSSFQNKNSQSESPLSVLQKQENEIQLNQESQNNSETIQEEYERTNLQKIQQQDIQLEHPFMKFGDTFVIKTNITNLRQSDQQLHDLIIIGNLQQQGSIRCVNIQNQGMNNPYCIQQKCFFTIRTPRNIQNDTNYILYGQRILLIHSKSNQSVLINLDLPAQESGSFQANLTSQNGPQNILRLMPGSAGKKVGDKIQYNDQIHFQQDSTRSYYLKLEKDEQKYLQNKIIDINAGDKPDCFQLQKIKNQKNNIIQIIHQQTQTVIATTEKQFSQYITIKTANLNNSDQQQQDSYILRILDLNKYFAQEYEVITSNLQNSYSFFEMQPLYPFTDQNLNPNMWKLKSLFTQQYLSVDPSDEKKLKLLQNFKQDDNSIFTIIQEQNEQINITQEQIIVSIQSRFGTFLQKTQNGKLQLQDISQEQSPQYFIIKYLDNESQNILEEINEIQNRILNFYVYLQSWSLITEKRKQNDDILVLDYQKALQQKNQLEQEAIQLDIQLQNLSENLIKQSNLSNDFKQKIMREQKFLEQFFALLKLIDNLIFSNQKLFQEKEKNRLYKIHRVLPQPQTAPSIVFKTLSQLPPLVYKIILQCIKNNQSNRKIALDNDEFLCQQIRNYGTQVSKILKESVRDQINIDLSEWVQLLEPLDEVGNNIYDMIIYLKIISAAVVDSQNKGVIRYQNKVCKELFSQGKNGKMKFLLRFNFLLDRPTCNIYREDTLQEFLQKNPSLSYLRLIRPQDSNEMEFFLLEELSEKMITRLSLQQFLNYLNASVNLLAQICKGRNKKCMRKVEFFGITSSHIQNVINSPYIPLSMKNSYLKLYEVLYIDIDPFLSINLQKCFYWNQLTIAKNAKIAQIFNHQMEPVEVGIMTKEFEEKMLPILLEILKQGNTFQEGIIKTKKKKQDKLARTPTINGNAQIFNQVVITNNKSKVSQKLKFLITLYHLIFKIIQLGYLTTEQIYNIIQLTLQIFVPYLQQKEKTLVQAHDNWLTDLINQASQLQYIELIDQLFQNAGLLFQQYFILQLNIQTLEFIKHFQNSQTTYWLQSIETLKNEIQNIIIEEQTGNLKNLVLRYLLGFYCSNQQNKGFEMCQQALQCGIYPDYLNQLKQIEIIQNYELDLYIQVTGNQLVGQIFSPIQFEVSIHQLEDLQNDGKQKDELIQNIILKLNSLINRMKEIKIDQFKLEKMQNFLRNLNVHKQILSLLKVQSQDTQRISIQFLCLFLLNNQLNCQEIKNDFFTILKLASNNIKVSKLIGVFISDQKDTFLQKLVKNIFSIMSEQYSNTIIQKRINQQFYYALLSILQNCKIQTDKMIILKREILSNLSKLSNYVTDIQYYRQYKETKSKKEELLFYGFEFECFTAATSLTALIINDFPQGIQQIQSFLFIEQIKKMIHNPSTSYLLKAQLIKFYQSLSQGMQINEMRDLLFLIINDLLLFPKYLVGILRNFQPKTDEEKDIITIDKTSIEQFKYKIFNTGQLSHTFQESEDKKKLLSAQTPGMPTQTNAALLQAQQINEQKRILIDNTEYWKYILQVSNWQNAQFGILVLLPQLFEEIIIKKWNFQEVQQEQFEDNLYEPLAFIKLILENIRQTLGLLEKELKFPKYKVYILQVQYQISKCLMKCPLYLSLKNFKPIRQEFKIYRGIKQQIKEYKTTKFGKLQPEDLKNNLNSFYEKLHIYMFNKHLTIYQMMDKIKGNFKFQEDIFEQEGQFNVDSQDRLVSKDRFCQLFEKIIDEHFTIIMQMKAQKNDTDIDIGTYLQYEDCSKYHDNYLQLRESTKNSIDIDKFFQKLLNYFNIKKFKYKKEELKALKNINPFQKQSKDESQFIQQTYQNFVYQYELLVDDDNPYNFYKLNQIIQENLSQQLIIKLENSPMIFSDLLKRESYENKTLALQLLYQSLILNEQQNQSVQEFTLKQIPNLLLYLEDKEIEYNIETMKKILIVLNILKNLSQNIKFDLGISKELFIKFVKNIFNQTDRLLSIDITNKNNEENNSFFYSKVGNNEKNLLLEQFLKILMIILQLISRLNLSILTEEVLYFVTNYFQYINRSQLTHICSELDILKIYTECLRCLNNFCQENQFNQDIVFNHKPLIQLIQFIITSQKYDLLSDNLEDCTYKILFKACVQLLLQVKLQYHEGYIQLNYQILFERLLKIYDSLEPRLQIVIQGQRCTHSDNINCSLLKCQQGLIAQGEFEIFGICFDLIILFNVLSEQINEQDNKNIKYSINFLLIYKKIRNLLDLKQEEDLNDYFNQSDIQIEEKNNKIINVIKKSIYIKQPIQQTKQNIKSFIQPKIKFKQSLYKISRNKQQIKQQLDELIPFKRYTDDQVIERKKTDLAGEIALNWLEQYQESTKRDINKKEILYKMARAIDFFMRFVGQIEIVINNQKRLQYFSLPFQSSFLLKQTIKKAKQIQNHKGKFEQLQTMAEYLSYELDFRQNISMRPSLNWLSININYFKDIIYILVLLLNIIYLAGLNRNKEHYYFQNSILEIIVILFTSITCTLAFIVLIIEIINLQPYITFKLKHQQKTQLEFNNKQDLTQRNKKFNSIKFKYYLQKNKLLALLTNLNTLYYIIYFVLILLSFFFKPLIGLVLLDIIMRIKTLKKILKLIIFNTIQILLIIYLTLAILFIYSFIGFAVIDYIILINQEQFTLLDIFKQIFRNGFLMINIIKHDHFLSWNNSIFEVIVFLFIFVFGFALIIGILISSNNHSKSIRQCKICGITSLQLQDSNITYNEHIEKQHKLSSYLFFLIGLQQKQDQNYVEKVITSLLHNKDMSWLPN